eukprot:TRINITY_DN11844_c0_g1_i5.p1 TRINITY_DN11844_c0_g1~~TRINITY_DN11844_c0_g1_i5.p1  ORF type:complete len:227 (+),score=31.46 TRINITY_DN11844_c0_g1_i5:436-1116(+)
MMEAKSLPDAVVAANIKASEFESLQTNYMPSVPDISDAPPGLHPSTEWSEGFVYGFDTFREELAYAAQQAPPQQQVEFPPQADTAAWRVVFVGQLPMGSPSEQPTTAQYLAPSFAVICQISPGAAASLLRQLGIWLLCQSEGELIRRRSGEWLFALLCRVDWLLDVPTQSTMRQILRVACDMRAELSPLNPEDSGSEAANATTEAVSHLNIFITIVGYYFRQAEHE